MPENPVRHHFWIDKVVSGIGELPRSVPEPMDDVVDEDIFWSIHEMAG